MKRRMFSCALRVVLMATVMTSNAWAASYVSSTDVIPNPDEVLQSLYSVQYRESDFNFLTLSSLTLSGATGGVAPPTESDPATTSIGDILIEVSLNSPGQPPILGAIRNWSKHKNDYAPAHNWKVEIDGLVVGGFPTQPTWVFRESPTLQSLGTTNIEPLPGGLFRISSFFDVFTELSVDNGQTWIPASGPLHMESVPEPSTLTLGMLGLAVVGFVARRKREQLLANR